MDNRIKQHNRPQEPIREEETTVQGGRNLSLIDQQEEMEENHKQDDSHLARCMKTALGKREARGIRRQLKTIPASSVDFSSNDFLSLATSSRFRARYLENLTRVSQTCKLGGTGARLLDVNSSYAEGLEKIIATFHNASSGLLFNSGFDANSSIFACIPQPGDVVLYDELIHASVHDGMRLSRAGKCMRFPHNSVDGFERVLRAVKDSDPLIESGQRNVFVAVETLYSMEGDFAPIQEILDIMKIMLDPQKNGYMIVDEAHSTGVFGPCGAGIVRELGVEDQVFLRLHTFGKALAGNGAIVLCSQLTRDYLLNYARPFIFTSAPGLPSLVSTGTAYEFMAQRKTEWLQLQLQKRIEFLTQGLKAIVPHNENILKANHHPTSPIFALQTRFPRELAKVCQDHGLMVRAIMPPTVPEDTARVRVCLHAQNTEEDIRKLIGTIDMWVKTRQLQAWRL